MVHGSPTPALRIPQDGLLNAARDFARYGFAHLSGLLGTEIIRRWRESAEDAVRTSALRIERSDAQHRLSYQVVTGEVVGEQIPDLYRFYMSPELLGMVRAVTGEQKVSVSNHERSSININALSGPEHVYRWHFDATPYTMILFLTSHTPDDGGELKLLPCPDRKPPISIEDAREIQSIVPRAGDAVLMDGTACYHSVAPLRRVVLRLSVPMVFPNNPRSPRPDGLDDYLYASSV